MSAPHPRTLVAAAIAILLACLAGPAAAASRPAPIYACISKASTALNLAGPGPRCPAGQRLVALQQVSRPAPVTGRDIAKRTITPRNLDLPRVRKFLQTRLQGRCVDGEALKYVTESGRIQCTSLSAGTITGIEAADGLTGGGSTGDVRIGVDPGVIQQRVSGRCTDNSALQAIGQDGSAACSPFQAPFANGGCTGAHEAINTVGAASGAVTCVPAVSKVTAGTGLTGGGGPGDVTIDADTSYLQRRVSGACTGTNAIASIAQDGTVGCRATGTGTVTSVDSGFGLTGGPFTTSGSLAADPTVLQRRVSGTCTTAGNTGVQSIAQDGTVSCGNLQNRVTGTCSGTAAVQSVTSAGGVGCTANLTPSSRVQALPANDVAVGSSVTIASTTGGFQVVGQCTSGPTAEIHIKTTSGTFNAFWGTFAGGGGFGAVGPATDQTILSLTTSPNMVTYSAAGISGGVNGEAVYGQAYAFTGSGQCQFAGDGITT